MSDPNDSTFKLSKLEAMVQRESTMGSPTLSIISQVLPQHLHFFLETSVATKPDSIWVRLSS